jgi:hypothetical protein
MPNHFHLLLETPRANLSTFMQRLREEPLVAKPFIHSVLRRFSDEIGPARQHYDRFVADGLAGGQWEDFYKIRNRKYLGNDQFVEEMRRHAGEALETDKPGCRRLDELLKAACLWSGVSEEGLRSRSKERTASRARQVFAYWAKQWKLASTMELANCLSRDPSAVSHMLRQVERSSEIQSFRESLKAKEGAACG